MTKTFKTQYDLPERKFSSSGNRYKIDYVARRDEFGRLNLVENGRSDLYAEIQSHKESTDLSLIISRFLNGDTSALSRGNAMYGDFVGIPTSLNDALRVVESAEAQFASLDADIRSRFDNDFGVFISMMDNPVEWSKRFTGKSDFGDVLVTEPVMEPVGGDS